MIYALMLAETPTLKELRRSMNGRVNKKERIPTSVKIYAHKTLHEIPLVIEKLELLREGSDHKVVYFKAFIPGNGYVLEGRKFKYTEAKCFVETRGTYMGELYISTEPI